MGGRRNNLIIALDPSLMQYNSTVQFEEGKVRAQKEGLSMNFLALRAQYFRKRKCKRRKSSTGGARISDELRATDFDEYVRFASSDSLHSTCSLARSDRLENRGNGESDCPPRSFAYGKTVTAPTGRRG